MPTPPTRPPDNQIEDVGLYYKAPEDNNLFTINNDLAGQPYVSDCDGTIVYNDDVPNIRFVLNSGYSDFVSEENLIIIDADGTIKEYYVHGEPIASDYYKVNDGITQSQYRLLTSNAKNFYCDILGGAVIESGINITNAGAELDDAESLKVIKKNTSGYGAEFTPIISKPIFNAGLRDIDDWDLAKVSEIIVDVTDLDGVDYSLTPLYDFPSLSGQEQGAIREKCRYFIRDIYYRYLGREADESGLRYYGNKIYDIFIRCAFGSCNYSRVNTLVVQGIRNSPEGLQYQERLRAGTVEKPEYVMPTWGSYTQPEKWKRLFGNDFFADSFTASGGGKLIGVKVDSPGEFYKIGDTFEVTSTDNNLPQLTPGEFELTALDDSGGKHFLKTPSETYVRETQKRVGVKIWNENQTTTDPTDCFDEDVFISSSTVTGSTDGVVVGSGPYGINSNIGAAAVHAGLIDAGVEAEISWHSAGPQKFSNLIGSTSNGVTSIDSPNTQGQCGITLKLIRIIGDTPDENPSNNILELIIDPNNPQNALKFKIEKNNTLIYNDSSNNTNRIIDQVVDIPDPNTTDEILLVSGNSTLSMFMDKISRLPSVLEFQQYARLFYQSEASLTTEITNKFEIQFSNELSEINQVIKILTAAELEEIQSEFQEQAQIYNPECVYNRNDGFYQPGPGGSNLGDIWEHLLRPSWSLGQDLENNPDDIADMSDFIGLKVQRWASCNDDDNPDLGTIVTEYVEWNVFNDQCENETYETNLAVFNVNAVVTYNNGLRKINDYVKTATDDDAIIINDQYINLLERPAERAGLEFWIDLANKTVEDDNGIYYPNGRIKFNDGTEIIGNLVLETKSTLANLINNKFLSYFERPAMQAGLDYWVNTYYENYDVYKATNAKYWRNSRVIWKDGSFSDTDLVETPLNPNAEKINSWYVNLLQRPAEREGLDYWMQLAEENGIDATEVVFNQAVKTEQGRGGNPTIYTGVNALLYHLENTTAAQQEISREGVDFYSVKMDRVLELFAKSAEAEQKLGGVVGKKAVLGCNYPERIGIDLSWFTNTRIPPPIGSLTLAKPRPNIASRPDDTIYLINSPADQNEIYEGFAADNNSSGAKKEFELEFTINWPEFAGEVEPGYSQPSYRKNIVVNWYKKTDNNTLVAKYRFSNVEDLEPQGFTNGPVPVEGYTDQVTFTYNSNLSQIKTSLTVAELESGSMSKDTAESLSYDESPDLGTHYFAEVVAENIPIDSDTKEYITNLGGSYGNISSYSGNDGCKFLIKPIIPTKECWNGDVIPITSVCPPEPTCPNGEKVCPDGTTKCVEDDCDTCPTKVCPNGDEICRDDTCPPLPPDCNSLSVSCGSNSRIDVEINSRTQINFEFKVNNAARCNDKGYALVSIRRLWSGAIFGPNYGVENSWVKDNNGSPIIKRRVSIVNGIANYALDIDTSKQDYLTGSNSHWTYYAYWEIRHRNISCRPNAWENPGCNTGGGFKELEEVLCIQKENCLDPSSGRFGSESSLQLGAIKNVEILNPYPNPRNVPTITPVIAEAMGIGTQSIDNPAEYTDDTWHWYRNCMSFVSNAFDGTITDMPTDTYNWKHISGPSFGIAEELNRSGLLTVYLRIWKYTRGEPLGCIDPSDGGYLNYMVTKVEPLITKQSFSDNGKGFAVNDVLEYTPQNIFYEDIDGSIYNTVPLRVRVTEIYDSESPESPPENPSSQNNAGCQEDCPICEQSIAVIIGETTKCGPVNYPSMIENNLHGQVNNGAFSLGEGVNRVWFTMPNDVPINLGREEANIQEDSQGEYVDLRLQAEVLIQAATSGNQVTTGRYNAVEFSEEDLYSKCCGDSQPQTFDCIEFRSRGGCFEGEESSGSAVDCNASMRVVAHWYYKYTFDNGTQSDLRPFNHIENGVAVSSVPEDYYPAAAGNSPNAMAMDYSSEKTYENGLHPASLFEGVDIYRKLYYPDNVKSVEILLQLKASNDEWGNDKYHPPSAGWNERDFGTQTRVSSLRWPWRPASIYAYGFKDSIFSVGKFSVSNTLRLPTVDWTTRIEGCSDAQVYAPLDYMQGGTYLCGDKNSPNWYECQYGGGGGDLIANETWRLNGVDGTSNGKPAWKGYVCAPELVGFPGCLPESDVELTLNTDDGKGLFQINWNDIPPPGNCQGGIKILWYVDGKLVSTGQLNDPHKAYDFLSCGLGKTKDLSIHMTNPEREYFVQCGLVLNNGPYIAKKKVNFNWTTQNGNPYSYNDYKEWAVERMVREDYPININENIRAGDFYQINLAVASCTVKGNTGPGTPPDSDDNKTEPSASIEMIANGPTDVTISGGSASVSFTAIANWDDGDYPPTPEPSLLTYGIINNNGGDREFNINRKTWTQTFTQPGRYNIGASFRKNYCPPNTTPTSTCAGKTSIFVKDSVIVNVEAEVISLPPTARAVSATYSNQENGCGLILNGEPVDIYQNIEITQGTGEYEWDEVTTTGGNYVKNASGTLLTQTIGRRRTSNGQYGTTVVFLKNGSEVHRVGSGIGTWCAIARNSDNNPGNPSQPPGGGTIQR